MESRYRVREYITAGLFLLGLLAGTVFWLWGRLVPEDDYAGMTLTAKADALAEVSSTHGARAVPARLAAESAAQPVTETELKALADGAEDAVNDELSRSHLFIELYGGIQRLFGRRMIEDADENYTVYKLTDGSLTFLNDEPAENLTQHAQALLEFRDTLAARDIPLLYVQAPQKIGGEGAPALPPGVTDCGNADADAFLAALTQGGGDVLDLRQTLREDGALWTSYFFATDHHWKPETGLLCTNALAQYLNEHYGLTLDLSRTDPAQYTAVTRENSFLGSQGKRVGSLYAGMDDFTVLTPDFETDFTYTIYTSERTGSFEQCLLFPERLVEEDPYQANPYTFYSGGDYAFSRIINHRNPDGPRIMILRDSFSCVLTPFLAMHCSDLAIVDLRYFYDYFPTYVDWVDPDLIVVLYSPGILGNDMAFDFFSEIEH